MRENVDSASSEHLPNSFQLAEPPHVRARLITEIKFFITSLLKRTDLCLGSCTQSRTRLVEYVTRAQASEQLDTERKITTGEGNRPLSGIKNGRETPLRPSSRSMGNKR